MIITKLKAPWQCLDLCWLIRIGKFKSTPLVRQQAKQVSFARAYGYTGKLRAEQ